MVINSLCTVFVQTGLLQVPDNLDAIVIGGGVSGLSTAATLSKAGQRQKIPRLDHF